MTTDSSGAAFPREDYQGDDAPGQRGLTKRELFAAMAMQAMLTEGMGADFMPSRLADNAVGMADLLLQRLAK